MPIYEYRCQDCGATFDKLVHSWDGPEQVECPTCHSKHCKKAVSLFSSSSASGSGATSCAPSG